MTASRTLAVAAAALALTSVAVAGCEGGSRAGSDQPGAAAVTPANPAVKTSVNTASEKDLAATLRGADVGDAEKWAQTLVTYRPYPAGEAGLTAIRQVLDRFGADPETTTKITAAVTA